MPARLMFTAVFETVEDGWTQARIAELPGVITAAPSRAETEDLLADALREYLLAATKSQVDVDGAGERAPLAVIIGGA